jgi:hypothetical protein
MPTKVYFQDLASDITVDTLTRQASVIVGASQGASSGSTFQTTVTNTATNPATPIQQTSTAGGSLICWVTPPLAGAVTISGTITINTRGREDNAAANAAIVIKITKYSGGSETATILNNNQTNLAELSTTDNIEGTTLGTAWTATPTSTAMAVGDRFVIRMYITNASGVTMAASHSVTTSYDGETAASAGDTWVQFNETVVFRSSMIQGVFQSVPPASQTGANIVGTMPFPETTGNVITGSGVDPAQP